MASKISKENLNALFSNIENTFQGRYHGVYESLGLERAENGNFHCINSTGHAGGRDSNGSMSINNDRGVWQCFTCGVKGNLYKMWKDYISDGAEQFHEFSQRVLGIAVTGESSGEVKKASMHSSEIEDMKSLYAEFAGASIVDKPIPVKQIQTTYTMDDIHRFTEALLNDKAKMEYLFNKRNITPEMVKKYKIGLRNDKKVQDGSFCFPVINLSGDLINIKNYNPFSANDTWKWSYSVKGAGQYPSPVDHFSNNRLFFFEGEPDVYCATAFGVHGAVTLGSATQRDISKMVGADVAKNFISGKEVVICFDSDDAGRKGAIEVASHLYKYARQIKIVDFDRSEINPRGLDPTVMKNVTKDGITKQKRVETDFTDFMHKNGFGASAIELFHELVESTPAYTDSNSKLLSQEYKVTVDECRSPKYHSYDVVKRLVVSAVVGEVDDNAYMYYSDFPVTCHNMGVGMQDIPKPCKQCKLPYLKDFKDKKDIKFSLYRDGEKFEEGNPTWIQVTEPDILSLIETKETTKQYNLKLLCGINPRCTSVRLKNGTPKKILRCTIMNDVVEYDDIPDDESNENIKTNSNVSMQAYVIGNKDVNPGQSYTMVGVQTISPNGQHVVLVVDKIESSETIQDRFVMTPEINECLKIFRARDDEDIRRALERRYRQFAAEDRINGRSELYMLCDLALFSQYGIPKGNDFLAVDRGWVEVAIIGESRCGKSIVGKKLLKRYRIGEFIPCSSSVTRSGILAGLSKQMKGQSKISWGAIPRNDKGVVMLDEVHSLDRTILKDMTASRGDGIVKVEMLSSGKAYARTAKIMVSNPNPKEADAMGGASKGYRALRSVYVPDEQLARFDAAFFVTANDEDSKEFSVKYADVVKEFNDISISNLILWQRSIKNSSIVYEEGFAELVNTAHVSLLNKYHAKTQLINAETKTKITRMATSLAKMMYSTVSDAEPNKVLVRCEHISYIYFFLDKIYSHENMQLDILSEQWRASEVLGDMRFMENIIKYIDISPLLRENSFNKESIMQIFHDYLEMVEDRKLYIEGTIGVIKKMHVPVYHGVQKLISVLTSRNALERVGGSNYKKSDMFSVWLSNIQRRSVDELSNILEPIEDKSADEVIKELESTGKLSR